MTRLLPLEQPLGVPRKFENLHALVHVGFVRFLMAGDLALQATLLLPPFTGKFVVEVATDLAVEFVHIHGANALIEPLVFGLKTLDRLPVFPPLVSMAGLQRLAHPGQHLVVKAQPPEKFTELGLQRLLTHVFAAAGGRVTQAFIGVASAMIIDVTLLFDLADH